MNNYPHLWDTKPGLQVSSYTLFFSVFRTIGCIVFSAVIVMVFLACVDPVIMGGFIDDVSKNGNDDPGGSTNNNPKLEWSNDEGENWEEFSDDKDEITSIRFTSSGEVIIKVANAEDYDTDSITWKYDGEDAGYDAEFFITVGMPPFDMVKTYILAAEGKKKGFPYSTSVSIVFIEVDTETD